MSFGPGRSYGIGPVYIAKYNMAAKQLVLAAKSLRCSRECLAIEVERSIDADGVVVWLEGRAAETLGTRLSAFRSRPRVHRPV